MGLSVGPLFERGLNEVLSLATSFGRVGLGSDVLDAYVPASITKVECFKVQSEVWDQLARRLDDPRDHLTRRRTVPVRSSPHHRGHFPDSGALDRAKSFHHSAASLSIVSACATSRLRSEPLTISTCAGKFGLATWIIQLTSRTR